MTEHQTIKKENPGRPEGAAGAKMLERMNRSHEPLRAFAFPLLPWRENMRILDVGCGGGAAIAEMLKLSPGSVIQGIDYSETSVRESSLLNREFLGSRCFIRQADAAALPFEDNSFDLVTAVETVYFWPDIQAGASGERRKRGEAWRAALGFQEVQVHHGPEQIICVTGGKPRL